MLSKVIKLVERRVGTYAAVKYEATTCAIVAEWCKINNIPNPVDVDKMHSTLIYSRVKIPTEYQKDLDEIELRSRGWRFLPDEFKLMPTSSDKGAVKEVLVLTLKAPELIQMHDDLCRKGATHDFDDFIPHVTLSYKVPTDFNLALTPPPVYFIPSKIYFEPLDMNWSDKK